MIAPARSIQGADHSTKRGNPCSPSPSVKSYAGAGGARAAVLREVDLDIAAGEYVAIMGESGSASRCVNLIAGLDTPDSGTITLAGTDPGAR